MIADKMANLEIHIQNCMKAGIDKQVCEKINKWMDEPSSWIPGCRHRQYRHSLEDCTSIANQFHDHLKEQAILACKIHIRDDCIESKEICKKSLPCKEVNNIMV